MITGKCTRPEHCILLFIIVISLTVHSAFAQKTRSREKRIAVPTIQILTNEPKPLDHPTTRTQAKPALMDTKSLVAAISTIPGLGDEVREFPMIMLAVYRDGTIIYSNDHEYGGAPYKQARIEQAQLEKLL